MLVFHGIDTEAKIQLNDVELGPPFPQNMFIRYQYDIKAIVKAVRAISKLTCAISTFLQSQWLLAYWPIYVIYRIQTHFALNLHLQLKPLNVKPLKIALHLQNVHQIDITVYAT